jgi:hypothetical protein
MENGPFIDDFHIKTSIYKGCSMANQMVPVRNGGFSSSQTVSLPGRVTKLIWFLCLKMLDFTLIFW